MRNYRKKSVTFLSLCCLIFCILSGDSTGAVSANSTISSDQFNIRVTRENFAEFCDSLVISDEKQKVKLDPLFFENFNLLTGDFEYKDLFSVNNEKFKPNALKAIRRKQAEEEENTERTESPTPSVYNVKLSGQKSNSRLISLNNDSQISANSYMYSMMSVDDKNTEFNFEKVVEKIKTLILQKNFSAADDALKILRVKSRGNNTRLFTLAGLYEKIDRPDEACGLYKEITDAEPNKLEYVYSYAVCLYKNDNVDLAEKYFLKATEIRPDFMYAFYNLGNLYYKKGDYYQALDYFNKAMEISPSSPDVCFNIAVTLELLDHKTLAKKYYSRCLELNPKDLQAEKALERFD